MKEDVHMHESATIAEAWVAAANGQDADRLAALSSPRYQRFDDLQAALASAGLDESHET
jgi:hypothetical protein